MSDIIVIHCFDFTVLQIVKRAEYLCICKKKLQYVNTIAKKNIQSNPQQKQIVTL